jgi:type IV secretion system protein TrbI
MADPTADAPSGHAAPSVVDRVPKPAGLLPRHTQTLVLVGLATVIVVVIALTGQPPSPAPKAQAAPPPLSVEASQARIQEYRERVDEQAKRLAAEQVELAVAKRSLAETAPNARPSIRRGDPDEPSTHTASQETDAPSREDHSLLADNLALTLRQAPAGPASSRPAPGGGAHAESDLARETAPAPLRAVSSPPVPISTAAVASTPPPAVGTTKAVVPVPDTYQLLEGSIIEAVLTTRLDGSQAGPVACLVTTPTFSRDYQTIVIPRGSRLLGTATPVERIDQQRLAVTFHRLLLPDGRAVSLERTVGLNQAGDVGLQDQVDRHYASLFGATLAVGALSGLAQMGTRLGGDASWGDGVRQSASSSVAQSSLHILDRFLNRLPTVTIREGHRVKVYLTGDLAVPASTDRPVPPVVPVR